MAEYYKEITLDSKTFRAGNVNRPTFYFNTFMDTLDYVNVTKAIVPTTFYVFTNNGYTSCTINSVAVSWPAGNYTPAEWIAYIAATYPALGVTITYSATTNKLTFTGTGSFSISFAASELAFEYLGFNADSISSVANVITTPNVIQFSGPNYLILHARIASVFNDSSIYFNPSAPLGVAETRDKMIMIPITENRNAVVLYDMTLDRYFEWLDSSTRNIEFYFTLGTRQDVVDFNGTSFQIKMAGFSYTGNGLTHSRVNNNVSTYMRPKN